MTTKYVASKIRENTARRNMENDHFVREAIQNSLDSAKQGPTYFVRPAGSFVVGQSRDKTDAHGGTEIAHWLMSLSGWREITPEVVEMGASYGRVRYFQTSVPRGCEAYEGVLLWGEMTPKQQDSVRVQPAHHTANKEEFVTDQVPLKRASVISIMVGSSVDANTVPVSGQQIVYTWYPGRVTPFRKQENLQDLLDRRELDYFTTVKSVVPV
jgi:hypothetical protein